jgi:hypothetical protein
LFTHFGKQHGEIETRGTLFERRYAGGACRLFPGVTNGNQDIMTLTQKCLAVALSFLSALTTIPGEVGAAPQANASSANQASSQDEYAVLGADELDALVAPIALYPDALLAQVIGAATFPDQILDAEGWLKENFSLKDKALSTAVDQKDWDPSVKALTQFPTVLDDLAKNLAWTSALGEASAMQQPDLMAAVQRMRAKAYAAGNLKSSPEIKIVQESPQVIVIQPANPQVVYVPAYNPTVVYATTVVTPGYSASTVATASVISFGAGIVVGMAISSNSCSWGYHSWHTNWGMGGVSYCRSPHYGNPYWWGGYYPGYRGHYPYPPRPPYYGYPPGYRPPYPPGYRPPYYNKPRPTPYSGNSGGRPTTLPANPAAGTRPTTWPTNPAPSTRPTTLPTNPTAGTRPATRPAPSTSELRGYPRPASPSAPAASTRPSAFPSSTESRAQSARGNQSIRSTPAARPATTPSRSAPAARPAAKSRR